MRFPHIQPLPLTRARNPFSHPDWIFELKWDGFRALAYIEGGQCRLVSRNGNEFKSFPTLNESIGNRMVIRVRGLNEMFQGTCRILKKVMSYDRMG